MNAMDPAEVRMAAVYSGLSYQHGVLDREKFRKRLEILPVCTLPETNLFVYDVLILPRGTDQEILYRVRDKIAAYLDSGKIVISFGEVTNKWLPACTWDGVKPEDDEPLTIHHRHPVILDNLKPDDLHWHKGATGWCCHGHFIAPEGAEILVTNMLGDPVMYIDRHSTKGVILAASQLDAICHSYHLIKGADVLLNNILRWAKEESIKIKKGKTNG